MNDCLVKVERVTKRFAGHTAVRDLSLEIPPATIFGLLGPNGAGKTTAIRIILGIIAPDEGRVELFGQATDARALSLRIGYLPEERGLYRKMKVQDQLIFFGEARGLPRQQAKRRARAWLERLGLGDWMDKNVEDLSKGMQQKVQFAGALLHEPDLVILDEPFSGLDPINSQVMRDVVVDLARQGRTVLFSTHIMEHAERMCDRIAIIARGEKVVDGRLADIKREHGGRHVALVYTRNAERAAPVMEDRTLVSRVEDYGMSATAELAPGVEGDRLLKALVVADVGLSRFEVVEPSLESIFIARAGREAAMPVARE